MQLRIYHTVEPAADLFDHVGDLAHLYGGALQIGADVVVELRLRKQPAFFEFFAQLFFAFGRDQHKDGAGDGDFQQTPQNRRTKALQKRRERRCAGKKERRHQRPERREYAAHEPGYGVDGEQKPRPRQKTERQPGANAGYRAAGHAADERRKQHRKTGRYARRGKTERGIGRRAKQQQTAAKAEHRLVRRRKIGQPDRPHRQPQRTQKQRTTETRRRALRQNQPQPHSGHAGERAVAETARRNPAGRHRREQQAAPQRQKPLFNHEPKQANQKQRRRVGKRLLPRKGRKQPEHAAAKHAGQRFKRTRGHQRRHKRRKALHGAQTAEQKRGERPARHPQQRARLLFQFPDGVG